MIKVAVVILNWNGSKMLQRFLPSVVRYSDLEGVTVYVADNGSTDDSISLLNRNFPTVKQLIFPENYGFAEGYNRALKQIESEYYVLLNSDVEVTEGWLSPLLNYLDHHQDTAACQPKIKCWKKKDHFEYAGAAGGFIDRYGYPFCRGRIREVVEVDKGQYEDVIPVFWASGACMVIRSSDYWRAGGLDGRFFAHMEEVDLCWRLANLDLKLVCIPQSTIYHVGGGTLNKEHPQKTFLNFRNSLVMLQKNLHEKELGRIMWMRKLLDYLAAFVFLLQGAPHNAKAVIKARRAFRKMEPELKCERQKSLKRKRTKELTGWKNYSILVKYYLKGKKYFSQL